MKKMEGSLWIGAAEVTAEQSSGKGWAYDSVANTLTLGGFNYVGEGYQIPDGGAAIWSSGSLTIRLLGRNHVEHIGEEGNLSAGIFTAGNLTITGEGSLTAIGGPVHSADDAQSIGIVCRSRLKVLGGEIDAAGGSITDSDGGLSVGIYTESFWYARGTITAAGGEGQQSTGMIIQSASMFGDKNPITVASR